MKRALLIGTVIGYLLTNHTALAGSSQDSIYYSINKSLQIFGDLFRQISDGYVDAIQPEKFIEVGMSEMLDYLDPYTVYIDGDNSDELDLLTKGVYGGLGMTISAIDGLTTVVDLAEGFAAERAGIRIGDKIYKIDSAVVLATTSRELRQYTRGEPGTTLDLQVIREGVSDTLVFRLQREKIKLKNVAYTGFVEKGIGYIKLVRFSRSASSEFRRAIDELKGQAPLNGLIIDLRDNPGGLLDAAVSISEIFLPTGSPIVSTKGRAPHSMKEYVSRTIPKEPDLPIAVLINGASASASEILAGAIQDLDRGVVVGERSFGKGLVQTISSLPYDASLKMTTAKYYTPSGRCIQRVNFTRKRSGIVLQPDDTLRTFTTKGGRQVTEANGIIPDTTIVDDAGSEFVAELQDQHMLFKYATIHAAALDTLPADFAVDSLVLKSFADYLNQQDFSYEGTALKKVKELEEIVAHKAAYAALMQEVQALEQQLVQMQQAKVSDHNAEIADYLLREIQARFFARTKRIALSLPTDRQAQAAASLLRDRTHYYAIIGGDTSEE